MLKPYFENGVLSEEIDAVTPGFTAAFSKGLIRYLGDSRTSKSGMERPLSVLFSLDNSKEAEKVFEYFKDVMFKLGIDAEKKLEEFDVKIEIRTKEKLEIEVFEVENGELFPIPQRAVNLIEHSLNTDTGLDL